jgi:L-alanine-DL-glutamate epimerase-like enolase superfamily enzyme
MRYDCSSPQALPQCRDDRGRDRRLRTKPKIPTVVRQDRRAKKSLHFFGYEGMSMIAVAGLDVAAWDALAGEDSVPL